MLKMASRTRSLVGRVACPRGARILRPPISPPMIRIRRWDLARRASGVKSGGRSVIIGSAVDEATESTDSASELAGEARPGAAAQLVIALTCEQPLASPSRHALADLDVVRISRGERGARRVGRELLLTIPDRLMSAE